MDPALIDKRIRDKDGKQTSIEEKKQLLMYGEISPTTLRWVLEHGRQIFSQKDYADACGIIATRSEKLSKHSLQEAFENGKDFALWHLVHKGISQRMLQEAAKKLSSGFISEEYAAMAITLAENPYIGRDTIKTLSRHPSKAVRTKIAKLKTTPSTILRDIALGSMTVDGVIQSIIYHEKHFDKGLHPEEDAVNNQNINITHLKEIVESKRWTISRKVKELAKQKIENNDNRPSIEENMIKTTMCDVPITIQPGIIANI